MSTAATPSHWRNRIVRSGDAALAEITANPANWRTHPRLQADALSSVLADVGYVQQVIINARSGRLVDGHLRVELAASHGETSVPAVWVDLSDDEERLILATATRRKLVQFTCMSPRAVCTSRGHDTESLGLPMFFNGTALAGLAAVYAIRNTRNGKVYVGSTANVAQRWRTHRKMLNADRHPNKHLQGAWRSYGADAFVFEVLEPAPRGAALTAAEQRWIDAIGATNPTRGYNLRLLATSNLGVRASAETRARLSAARMGNTNARGVKQSAATIEKRRQTVTGRKFKRVPERNGWSDERRAAFAEKMRGRPSRSRGMAVPAQVREKIRATITGRKHTDAARATMSAVQKARWDGHTPAPTYRYVKKGRPHKVWQGFVDPAGVPAGRIANLRAFSLERGLNPECMYNVAMGRQRQHKGWTTTR